MDISDGAPGRATISGAADKAGYGAVARSLHWLIVAFAVNIVSLIPLPPLPASVGRAQAGLAHLTR